jgi:hypothetical protein
VPGNSHQTVLAKIGKERQTAYPKISRDERNVKEVG